ncbi:H-NS histone family protein [Paraburkholderia oxyphila]|uniref:H-NS histone family protein n=1 Tax=Paraburkholderia oxyphila TaxID=614212 RepID=UPI00047FCDF9|nr:H-NS histone family protein [Paraburkholderia oxyphila]
MATYKELKLQMAELQVQLTAARQAEFQAALEDIRAKVAEYGFTEQEIFGRRRGRSQTPNSLSPAKYRDPQSGATWSGRGRAPNWLKDAKNRDRFLVSD